MQRTKVVSAAPPRAVAFFLHPYGFCIRCYHGKGSQLSNQPNKDVKCKLLWPPRDQSIRTLSFSLRHMLQFSVEAGDVLLAER